MSLALPLPIARYFTADKSKDATAIVAAFTEDAIVRDEGQTYVGHAAIRQWKLTSSSKYTYTVAPFALTIDQDASIVTAHLAGDFPGSPVDLRYRFVLAGDRIAGLEITL